MSRFYDDQPEQVLRFGDVIKGFHAVILEAQDPSIELRNDWAVRVSNPACLIVMTPCCSIDKKSIAMAPLIEIRPSFLDNEYFAEDLTRINRKVSPEKSVSRSVWDKHLSPERKQKLIAAGRDYAVLDCFIYEAHDLLKMYQLDRKKSGPIEMGYYMVDFKTIYRINCDKINRNNPAPPGMKILQLSMSARDDLRNKLSLYFGRTPPEDQV